MADGELRANIVLMKAIRKKNDRGGRLRANQITLDDGPGPVAKRDRSALFPGLIPLAEAG